MPDIESFTGFMIISRRMANKFKGLLVLIIPIFFWNI